MTVQSHTLKTVQPYFDAVKLGEKTFEVRKNDRFYQRGDFVNLRCFNIRTQTFDSGEKPLTFMVGPVLQGGQLGIEAGYCVFSLIPLDTKDNDDET
jgi:hypothetical protein